MQLFFVLLLITCVIIISQPNELNEFSSHHRSVLKTLSQYFLSRRHACSTSKNFLSEGRKCFFFKDGYLVFFGVCASVRAEEQCYSRVRWGRFCYDVLSDQGGHVAWSFRTCTRHTGFILAYGLFHERYCNFNMY